MKLRASSRFARRAIVHLRPARSSIFRAAGRPIERRLSPAPTAAYRHRPDVRSGGALRMSRCHWKIPAPVYGSTTGRVGPLLRRIPASPYFSQSGDQAKNDDDVAAVIANRPVGALAWVHRAE